MMIWWRKRTKGQDVIHEKRHHKNTSMLYLVQVLFPENKLRESHRQFELSIHDGLQESPRRVADRSLDASDVPEARKVCT